MPDPVVPAVARAFRDIDRDAFYAEEASATTNSSTLCPLNTFASLTFGQQVANPLDATVPSPQTGRPDPLPRPETIPSSQNGVTAEYLIFVPQSVKSSPPGTVKVSLLFCVGSEINRHGLRTFFKSSTDRVLITIPGREAKWIKPPAA